MPSHGQNIVYTSLKKIEMNAHCQFDVNMLVFIPQNVKNI